MANQKAFRFIIFPLVYAISVTVLTIVLATLPTFLHIEYAFYDPIQQHNALTDLSDQYHADSKLRLALDEVVCINIDTTFFDLAKVRVKRRQLAQLLDAINQKSKPKSIFLDFMFTSQGSNPNIKTAEDKKLIQSIAQFKSPIVLPNSLTFDTFFFWEKLSAEDAKPSRPLLYQAPNSGHLAPMMLVGDEAYRYLQFKTDDDSLHSAIYKLLEVSRKQSLELLTLDVPNRLEINYIINDEQIRKKIPVLKTYDASSLLQFDSNQLKEVLSDHIIFIGLFSDWKDEYGRSIDKFKTPLGEKTGGIYILLNAFINVVTHTYFQRVHSFWVFLLNFLIAIGGVWYYAKNQNHPIKSWKRITGEIMGSSILFFVFIWLLYSCWNLKFPFVITTIFYLRNQYLFELFQKYFTQKLKL